MSVILSPGPFKIIRKVVLPKKKPRVVSGQYRLGKGWDPRMRLWWDILFFVPDAGAFPKAWLDYIATANGRWAQAFVETTEVPGVPWPGPWRSRWDENWRDGVGYPGYLGFMTAFWRSKIITSSGYYNALTEVTIDDKPVPNGENNLFPADSGVLDLGIMANHAFMFSTRRVVFHPVGVKYRVEMWIEPNIGADSSRLMPFDHRKAHMQFLYGDEVVNSDL
ncbi:MAG: hypothetical protein HQL59_06265 [Magnetococcales bacterium]|nr:hypothetical protein [Magnetococcales bacterium]